MSVMVERSLKANAGLPRISSSQHVASACYWTLYDLLTIGNMMAMLTSRLSSDPQFKVHHQVYHHVCTMAMIIAGVERRNWIDGKLHADGSA